MEYDPPAGPTQDASPDRTSLVERIRTHHQAVYGAAQNMVREAVAAGVALVELKKLVNHGEWGRYLHQHCELGERQAERYVQLARLVGANPSSGTDLAGLSIQAAIKKLSPPAAKKDHTPGSDRKDHKDPAGQGSAKHTEILEVWLRTSPEAHQRAVDGIGLAEWLAAMPPSWLPELERRIDRQHTAAAKTTTDPTIGKALRQALSLQQTAKSKNNYSASVAAALNGILNKLKAAGLDLNDVDVVVRAPTAKRRAA